MVHLFSSHKDKPATEANAAAVKHPAPNLANPTQLRLPSAFNLYHKKGLLWKFYLGTQKDEHIYGIDMPQNEWGDVRMCDGEDETAPQIALFKRDSYLKGLVKVWLPPMGHGAEPICEELRLHGQMVTEKYSFAVLVGRGGGGGGPQDARPEKFEWRPTGMSKIPGMGSLAMSFELVRLSHGNEIVAKFSNGTAGGIRSKLASFEFVNSGASGEMGDLWALMATMSFIRIWQRYFQSYGVLSNVTAAGA